MTRRIERPFVALAVSSSICVTLTQLLATVLRMWFKPGEALMAAELSWSVMLVGILFAATEIIVRSKPAMRWIGILIAAAGVIAMTLYQGSFGTSGLALFFGGVAETQVAHLIAERLPQSLDGILRRRPVASLLWVAVGVVLMVQAGRLGAFMADDRVDWWLTTRHPLWAKHMCLPGYIEPADLHMHGVENIYDIRHYPALNRNAAPALSVRNMESYIGDPFQYPPQFLLGPYLILKMTDDFMIIRLVWYVFLVSTFVVVAFALGRWLQPEAGWGPMLLAPLVLISVPAIQSFQYGQFHVAAIAIAIAGMIAFEREQHPLGGLLLAVAILAKIFPAILLLLLGMKRQWNSIGWTVGFIVMSTVLSLLVFGSRPFDAFLLYHLPRLLNGESFAFASAWPELRDFFIGDNLSPGGIVAKLHELGIPGTTEGLGSLLLRGYSILVAIGALLASRNYSGRLQKACIWLALLNLAALESPGAWADYITVGTVWLLSLFSGQMYRGILRNSFLAACWLFSFTVVGIQPMPEMLPAPLMMVFSIIGTLLLVAVNSWTLFVVQRSSLRTELSGSR